jgi:hypothetical protein
MTKTSKDRRLGLRRETVRRLTAIDPADLALVAGGWKSWHCPQNNESDTFGKTTYLC